MAGDGSQRRFYLGAHGQPLARMVIDQRIDHRGPKAIAAHGVDAHLRAISYSSPMGQKLTQISEDQNELVGP